MPRTPLPWRLISLSPFPSSPEKPLSYSSPEKPLLGPPTGLPPIRLPPRPVVRPHRLGHALEPVPLEAGGQPLLDVRDCLGAVIRQCSVDLDEAGT